MSTLNKEEKEVLKSVESGHWRSVKNLPAEMRKHQKYARAMFQKDRRVNIRISSKDLEGVQKKAMEEGIPYQTLISSIIYKFVSGILISKPA